VPKGNGEYILHTVGFFVFHVLYWHLGLSNLSYSTCAEFKFLLCCFSWLLFWWEYRCFMAVLQGNVSWNQPIWLTDRVQKERAKEIHNLLSSQLLRFKQTDSTQILKYLTAVRHASCFIFNLCCCFIGVQ